MQVRAARFSTVIEHDYSSVVSQLNQITQICEGHLAGFGFFGLLPTYYVREDGIGSRGEADLDLWPEDFRALVSIPGRYIATWQYQDLDSLMEFLHDFRLKASHGRALGIGHGELVLSLFDAEPPSWLEEYPGEKTIGRHW